MTDLAKDLATCVDALEKATPGEWSWIQRGGRLEISAPHGGGTTVMDFCRLGMHGAQPRFGVSLDGQPRGKRGGFLVTASELIGSNPDGELRHPDADLLIAAVNFLRTHAPTIAELQARREWSQQPANPSAGPRAG